MLIYHVQPPHVITISVFQSFSCAHACFMGVAMPSEYVYLSNAAIACNYHFSFPIVQLCSCMFHAVQYRYAIRICSFITCNHRMSLPFLFPKRSMMLMHVCLVIPVPFRCWFYGRVIIPSALVRELLMDNILHHLAGRNVSTEQQRSWSPPPISFHLYI